MAFTIELLKLPPGYERLSKLPEAIQANILSALEDGMQLAVKRTQENYLSGPRPTRLGVVTGLLRSRIKSKVVKGKLGKIFAEGILGVSGVEYARIHELGGRTKPHPIDPVSKPYLVFFWAKLNRWVKLKHVDHPGSKIPARPYLLYGMRMSVLKILIMIQKAINLAHKET